MTRYQELGKKLAASREAFAKEGQAAKYLADHLMSSVRSYLGLPSVHAGDIEDVKAVNLGVARDHSAEGYYATKLRIVLDDHPPRIPARLPLRCTFNLRMVPVPANDGDWLVTINGGTTVRASQGDSITGEKFAKEIATLLERQLTLSTQGGATSNPQASDH